jgi:antitoxin ParD1/3/4
MRGSLNISLPATLRGWVLDQVERGGFSSASEYVRHLLREERKRHLQESVDDKLRAGLQSGPAGAMDNDEWKSLHREARQTARVPRSRQKR